jgi:hypothetical protein
LLNRTLFAVEPKKGVEILFALAVDQPHASLEHQEPSWIAGRKRRVRRRRARRRRLADAGHHYQILDQLVLAGRHIRVVQPLHTRLQTPWSNSVGTKTAARDHGR